MEDSDEASGKQNTMAGSTHRLATWGLLTKYLTEHLVPGRGRTERA